MHQISLAVEATCWLFMMNKRASFVEGQTEQLFVERLVLEVAGVKHVHVERRQAFGGRRHERRVRVLEANAPASNAKWFVLIVDCSADSRVKSDIIDQYSSLAAKGFTSVIGIRDVFPKIGRADIQKLRDGLKLGVKTKPIEVLFVLGVMEVEAWFISEYTHFERVDSRLSLDAIKGAVGFDPRSDDIQLRDNPAEDLNAIYNLAGKAYDKRRDRVERTLGALDFATVYVEVAARLPDLTAFVQRLDGFLTE